MTRRGLLNAGVGAMTAFTGIVASIPFVVSLRPGAKAEAAGGPVEIDLSKLTPGEVGAYLYRHRPILVLRRTKKMLQSLAAVEDRLRDGRSSDDPSYVERRCRSLRPEYLVVEGVCTHLGCMPQQLGASGRKFVGDWWRGGFFCRCHGSAFDYAGRVIRGPAPRNLAIPLTVTCRAPGW